MQREARHLLIPNLRRFAGRVNRTPPGVEQQVLTSLGTCARVHMPMRIRVYVNIPMPIMRHPICIHVCICIPPKGETTRTKNQHCTNGNIVNGDDT